MKIVFALVFAIVLGYAYCERYVLRPKLEARIVELESEITLLKPAKGDSQKKAPLVEKSAEPLEKGALENNIQFIQETPVVKVDNSPQILALEKTLEELRINNELQLKTLDQEIQRGLEAREIASNTTGDFKELRGNRGIRTSDADREAWERDKQARIAAINQKLEELNLQRDSLKTTFAAEESSLRKQIRELK